MVRFATSGFKAMQLIPSAAANALQWLRKKPYGLAIALLLIAGWPVATSWMNALADRPWQENSVQFGTLVLILLALGQSFHRGNFPASPAQPSRSGCLFLLFASLGYLIADFYSVKSMLWVSYIGILGGYCWAMFGRHMLLRWLPIFLFSGFLLPTVNAEIQMAVSLPLQVASAKLATLLTGWLIPVNSVDTLISIGEETLQVTPACSGLQSWMGFLFAGLLWQMFESNRPRKLLWLIIGSLFLSWFLNGLRLGITAVTAHFAGIDPALAIHTNLDWVLFPLGLFILWRSKLFLKMEKNIATKEPGKALASWVPVAVQGSLILVVAGHFLLTEPAAKFQPHQQAVLKLPYRINDWSAVDLPMTPEEQKAFGSAKGISREYTRSDNDILWVRILQSGSIADIHNFYGCLMVQGIRPKFCRPCG
jgi:exosortase